MLKALALFTPLAFSGCANQPALNADSNPPPFVYSAFAAGGNATGLRPQAVAFHKAFEERRAVCVGEIGQRSLSSLQAVNFCDCQLDVFSRGMSDEEMKATEDATFGSKSDASVSGF
jgi:hypothetical protein